MSYVPILKTKPAELNALATVSKKKAVTPLLEVAPPESRMESDIKKLASDWGSTYPVFVDAVFLDDDELDVSNHPLKRFCDVARGAGLAAIPTVDASRSTACYDAAAEAVQNDGRGCCFRLFADDFDDPDELAEIFDALQDAVQVSPADVHVVLDQGSVENMRPRQLAGLAMDMVEDLPDPHAYASLTVAGAAIPESLAMLSRNQWNPIPRVDWLGWKQMYNHRRRPARMPSYGDYGVSPPPLPPSGPATILAQLRYSTDEQFFVWKGANAIRYGFEQFNQICADLVNNQPFYYGESFSEGDRVIAEKARPGASPGNATTWRQVATSHHIEVVLDQLATLASP